MILAICSIVTLVLVVVVSNMRKLNIGIVSMCAAIILGVAGGLAPGDIVSGFNTGLFVQSVGMSALVVVAKDNGTLSYMSQKIMQVGCGRAIKIMPIFLYAALTAAEFAGMNLFPMVVPLLVALAFEMGMDVLKVMIIGLLSMLGGGQALFAGPGLYLNNYVVAAKLDVNGWNIAILSTIAYTLIFFIIYFLFGWHKEQPRNLAEREKPKITKSQMLTLLSFLALVIGTVYLKWNIMVVSTAAVVLHMIVGACDKDKVVNEIPYSTLLMIAGMTMLTGVMTQVGGIEVLADAISKVANSFLIKPVLSVIASAMSFVAHPAVVVEPTLVSMVPTFMKNFNEISAQAFVAAIGIGSYATAVSPLSSAGMQVMVAYDAVYQPNENNRLKVFNKLFLLAGINAIVQMILHAVGFYGIQIFG